MRLGQIRRRLRLLAAIEGAVAGAAAGALLAAAGLAFARLRGAPPAGVGLAALIPLAAVAGALTRGARRISLARCARIADAALDGHDRLLSALTLEALPPTPFTRALVADAVRRAEVLVPGSVVPARRPAGLPALGVAGLALAGAALLPTASRAARVIPPAAPAERGVPLAAGLLDAERDAARAAAAEAARLGDARLAALAAELDRALRRLASGALGDGAALDLLGEISARATEAARAAGQDRQAAEAAARALETSADTRAAGAALARGGEGDGDRAREMLGVSAAENPAETARALAAAAASLSATAGAGQEGAADDSTAGRRRLARDDDRSGAAAHGGARPGDAEQRHLERLRRDLDDTAAACRDGDPSCRARAEERARDLERLGRQGAAREGLERLARATRQLRERVGRGELRDGDGQSQRGFGRAATGERGDDDGSIPGDDGASTTGAEGSDDGPGSEGQGGPRTGAPDDAPGNATGSASAALGAEGGDAPGTDQGGTGNGIGHQAGGAPMGARPDGTDSGRGTRANVPVADGAGPSRAEVIGAAAARGFANPAYARAFADYAAALEDALDTGALPEGKRYLVRRYFDLIRPRRSPHAPGGQP